MSEGYAADMTTLKLVDKESLEIGRNYVCDHPTLNTFVAVYDGAMVFRSKYRRNFLDDQEYEFYGPIELEELGMGDEETKYPSYKTYNTKTVSDIVATCMIAQHMIGQLREGATWRDWVRNKENRKKVCKIVNKIMKEAADE